MPDLPALPFRAPEVGERTTRPGPRPRITGPAPGRQQDRLASSFQQLTESFAADRLALTDDPGRSEPDRVIVLEIAGELQDFQRAVERVPGLEFLAEEVLDKIDPDEFAAVDPSGRTQRYARQLLLVASSGEAWQRLLSLWHTYLTGEPLPTGFAAFRDVFSRLRTLRPWDDHDRLERTGAIDVWEREVASLGEELVEFEVELWLRADPDRRRIVSDGLRADLEAAGGEFVSEFVSDDIDYHGVLGRVPASRLLDAVARHEVVWLRTESVRLFRAVGQMAVPEPADAGADPAVALTSRPLPSGDARLALFDGFPLARHEHLRDRILIDDPEGWETTIGATRRVHGTAMASVILHGDLNDSSSTLAWPLYVRPILRATAPDWSVPLPKSCHAIGSRWTFSTR